MIVWGTLVVVGFILLAALAIGVVVYCLIRTIDNTLRKLGW